MFIYIVYQIKVKYFDMTVRFYTKGEDSCWILVSGFILIGGELPLF